MHDRIADLQLGQIFQQAFGGAGALAFAGAAGDRAARVKLGFGDDRELAVEVDEAGGERAGGELESVQSGGCGLRVRRPDHRPALQHARLQAIFRQRIGQGFAPAQAFRDQQGAAGEAVEMRLQAVIRVFRLAFDFHGRRGHDTAK